MIQVRKTLKYRLYQNRRNRRLHQRIDTAGIIWNHMVALQRRYYRLTGGYISRSRMQRHLLKLRRQSPRFVRWQMVGSQAVQELAERHDKGYQRFFAYKAGKNGQRAGRPGFKKIKQYKSFTLKQTGWKYPGENKIYIQGYLYKFSQSRPIAGEIKTVTIKRDNLGHLWVCFSVVQEVPEPVRISTGKIGGFDFGLRTFLVDHEGNAYNSPQFLQTELNEIARLNRSLSRKKQGSHNRHKAKRQLAKVHQRIADKRQDAHWKLAHRLCREFDLLCFETLNISSMKRLWGRKIADLGFSDFMDIAQQVAAKIGSRVQQVNKWEPTTQTCFLCLCQQSIPLSVRHFHCSECGWSVPRDQNAALNIVAAGASAAGLGDVRRQLIAAISAGPLWSKTPRFSRLLPWEYVNSSNPIECQ